MKASKSINEVLKITFMILEKNSLLSKPNRLFEFKIIEKEIANSTVGIGINEDCSAIKIYMIKNDYKNNHMYETYDERKYRPTFRIGIPKNCGKTKFWRVELENEPINADAGNPQKIAKHFEVVTEILQIINIISHSSNAESY